MSTTSPSATRRARRALLLVPVLGALGATLVADPAAAVYRREVKMAAIVCTILKPYGATGEVRWTGRDDDFDGSEDFICVGIG
jgi:hypothetical protein